jgi:hypothetical protein
MFLPALDLGGAPMQLKTYQIDGRLLRTGAVNFSAPVFKRRQPHSS